MISCNGTLNEDKGSSPNSQGSRHKLYNKENNCFWLCEQTPVALRLLSFLDSAHFRSPWPSLRTTLSAHAFCPFPIALARNTAMNSTLLTLFHIHFPKEISGNKKEICWFHFSLVDLIFY